MLKPFYLLQSALVVTLAGGVAFGDGRTPEHKAKKADLVTAQVHTSDFWLEVRGETKSLAPGLSLQIMFEHEFGARTCQIAVVDSSLHFVARLGRRGRRAPPGRYTVSVLFESEAQDPARMRRLSRLLSADEARLLKRLEVSQHAYIGSQEDRLELGRELEAYCLTLSEAARAYSVRAEGADLGSLKTTKSRFLERYAVPPSLEVARLSNLLVGTLEKLTHRPEGPLLKLVDHLRRDLEDAGRQLRAQVGKKE